MNASSRDGDPNHDSPFGATLCVLENAEGNTFVYDHARQDRLPEMVILFSVAERKLARFQTDRALSLLRKVPAGSKREHALVEYEGFLKGEHENKNLEAELKNETYLREHGFSRPEWRTRSDKVPPRVTHCWRCKESLDSRVDSEHVVCGWIICVGCGACGCGYDSGWD